MVLADEMVVQAVFLSAGADPEKLALWMSKNLPRHSARPRFSSDSDVFPAKGTHARAHQ